MRPSKLNGIALTECVLKDLGPQWTFTTTAITLPAQRIAKVSVFQTPDRVQAIGVNLPAASIELRNPGGHIYVKETREEVTALMNTDPEAVHIAIDFKATEQRVIDSLATHPLSTETGRVPRNARTNVPREDSDA